MAMVATATPMELEVDLGDMPSDASDQAVISGLGSLLGNVELCDIQINAGGETFYAHRAVLAAVSTSFKEVLSQWPRTADAISPEKPMVFTFDDIKYPEAVKVMLDCLYGHIDSGAVTYNPSNADANRDVLWLAQKFQIQPLQNLASTWLITGLATDNILDRLLACEEFKLPEVRSHIMSQLIANPEALFVIAKDCSMQKVPGVLQDLLLRILKMVGADSCPQAIAREPNKKQKKAGA